MYNDIIMPQLITSVGIYLLMPLMACIMVVAQSLWATVIKSGALNGGIVQIAISLSSSWKMWLGALLYIIATLVYFVLLSKIKFFSVQIPMTALSIIFSLLLSIFLFNEKPTLINSLGIAIVFIGILFVLHKQ